MRTKNKFPKRLISNQFVPQLKFKIVNQYKPKINKKFRRVEKSISFVIVHNFGDYLDLSVVRKQIEDEFHELIQRLIENEDENKLITIQIDHQSLSDPIYIGHQKIKNFKVSSIIDRIERYAQSNKSLLADGKIDLKVVVVENVRGNGISKTRFNAPKTLYQFSNSKRSVINIENTDNSCGFRAIFVAKYYYDNLYNLDKNEWQRLRKDYWNLQTKGAHKIANDCGLDFNTEIGKAEWDIIQRSLQDYQITVIDATFKNNFIYRGQDKTKRLYIEYLDSHYNAIINIKGYMTRDYFCEKCHVVFKRIGDHRCENYCIQCFSNCDEKTRNIICADCQRTFFGEKCYMNHLKSKLCKNLKHCEKCNVEYKTSCGHECEVFFCKKCRKSYQTQPHFCFVKPNDKEKLVWEDNINKIIVAYDIESMQNDGEHVPNLLVQKTSCDKCYEMDQEKCEYCFVDHPNYYFGNNCIKSFVDYLFVDLAKKAEDKECFIYAFAHNARGYDAQFVLREVWNRFFTKVDVIMRGRKILIIKCGNIKLLDSLNFFLQPLEKLPRALGLDVSISKGDFPHLFNKKENFDYVGKIPDLKYFGLDYVSPSKKSKIVQWHQEKLEETNWNFKEELIKYCENDVDILMRCVMKFRNVFKDITGLDPITRAFTLASIGLEVFKATFLSDDNILAITPVEGYSAIKNHSISADIWLDWIQNKNKVKLKREYRIGKYWVDGYDENLKTIYEFNGCHWHGHECQNKNLERSKSLEDKLDYLEKRGYNIVSIWECEYKKETLQNKLVNNYHKTRFKYYKQLEKYGHAELREAFFGGRTNNLKFSQSCTEDEEIKYLDFCSLYPYVLKNRMYPVGHPEVIRENFDYSLDSYFGFIKCRIEPPRKLYLPVLPIVVNDKLMFPLCIECAKNQNFNCSCEDRSMVNTWTTEEVKRSIEKGYKIKEIFEVLNYSNSSVDGQLFKKYIDMWLKIKQEASGWPSWCESEEDKKNYISDYEFNEGIKLEYEKIGKNEALRFIAKIMLNSFWGKLAQRPNQPQTSIINSYDAYFDLIIDKRRDISGEMMVNEDTLVATWCWMDDDIDNVKNYNVAVGCYVTAWARLKLYDLMEQIEMIRPYSLLYHDTDSVLYLRKLSDPEIKCGDYLGELTNEISIGKCIKFVSLGPKNYGYVVDLGNGNFKTEIKCKGISLSCNARELITFDRMIELVEVYSKENKALEVLVPQRQFVINRHCQIFTRYFDKVYKAVSEKRVISSDITLPFGY